MLERREVLIVERGGRRADLGREGLGHSRHLERFVVVPERRQRLSDVDLADVGMTKWLAAPAPAANTDRAITAARIVVLFMVDSSDPALVMACKRRPPTLSVGGRQSHL